MSVCITKKNLIIEDGERPTILLKLDENPNKAVGHVSSYCDLVFRFKKLLNGFVNTFSLETYIAENINEDSYLSVDTNMTKVVKVICPDGDHRFTFYLGRYVPMSYVRFSSQMKNLWDPRL